MGQWLAVEEVREIAEPDVAGNEPADGCCGLPPSLRLASDVACRHAEVLKVLGHPVRLQIVDLLARFGGRVCVCDIERQFTLSQPTISHHLRILRQAGLVESEQRGLWVYYYLRRQPLTELQQLIAALQTPAEEV